MDLAHTVWCVELPLPVAQFRATQEPVAKGQSVTIEYIRYTLTTHTADAFLDAYRTAVASLRDAPECLGYELTRCEEADDTFILRIRWVSTEAHLQGFRKSPNFPPFLGAIRPFVPEIAEMRHYAETGLAWAR